jgi:hypothetical protein
VNLRCVFTDDSEVDRGPNQAGGAAAGGKPVHKMVRLGFRPHRISGVTAGMHSPPIGRETALVEQRRRIMRACGGYHEDAVPHVPIRKLDEI